MNKQHITSLKDLQIKKIQLKKELNFYEIKLQNDYYKLTHPFESYLNFSSKINAENVAKAIDTTQKIVSAIKLGISVYKTIKGKKK